MKPCMYVSLQKSRKKILNCLGELTLFCEEAQSVWRGACLFGKVIACLGGPTVRGEGPARYLQRLLLRKILRRDVIVIHPGSSTFIHWAFPKH